MKKNILFIQEELKGGGTEKVLIDILNNFDYSNYNVTLLLVRKTGIYLKQIPSQVYLINIFGDHYSFTERLLIKLKTNCLKHFYQSFLIKKKLQRKNFDAIISFMEGNSLIFHNYILTHSKRNITWVHTDLQKNNWCLHEFSSLEEEKQMYQKMNDVVFVSTAAKNAFNQLFNEKRNTIIYNLIDNKQICEKSAQFSVNKMKFTICNVGRLTYPKRQDRIIEIASIIKSKGYDMEFWIVGTGELESELKEKVKKKELEDSIIFKGFQENPYPFIKAADVFLLTSEAEGFSLVVCEAMCLGKPIVSTKVTGPTELLKDNAGILCDEDTLQLAGKLIELFLNPSLIDYYKQRSKERSHLFDISKSMNQIYQEINC